jgi:hypothetical protein
MIGLWRTDSKYIWADAKMIVDYTHFDDHIWHYLGTNKEYRPFGVFVGFNHFGAALMYDETYKWLFNAFLSAHNNKQCQTIFTNQDIAMWKVVSAVLTIASHGLCTYWSTCVLITKKRVW